MASRELIYNLDKINRRLREDCNDINAIYALRDFVDLNSFPIEQKEIYQTRTDGIVYNTNIESLVLRESSDPQADDEFMKFRLNNILFIQPFGKVGELFLEQKIYGIPMSETKLTRLKFQNIYELLILDYPEGYNHRNLSGENVYLIGSQYLTPKIINFATSTMRDVIPLLDLYHILVETCYLQKINSNFLKFFNLTLSEITNWKLPEEYDDRKINELVEFAIESNTWIANGGWTYNNSLDIFNLPSMSMILTPEMVKLNSLIFFRNYLKINEYISNGYLINKILRRGGEISSYTMNSINGIIQAIDEAQVIEEEYSLYRGIGRNIFADSNIATDPGFASKTSSIAVASDFSLSDRQDEGYVLRINYPRGTKQIFLGDWESEFLTYPGETFELIESVKKNGYVLQICRYLGHHYEHFVNPMIDLRINQILEPILRIVHLIKSVKYWLKWGDEISEIEIQDPDTFYSVLFPLFLKDIPDYFGIVPPLSHLPEDEYIFKIVGNEAIEIQKGKAEINEIKFDFVKDNEIAIFSNLGTILKFCWYQKLINFELSRRGPISIESFNAVSRIIRVIDQIKPLGRPYYLYASSISPQGFIDKDLEETGIRVSYPGNVRQLYHLTGYITYPNEVLREISNGFQYLRNNFKIPEVSEDIDKDVERRIEPILSFIYKWQNEKFWIIKNNKMSLDVVINKKNLFEKLFATFLMDEIDYIVLYLTASRKRGDRDELEDEHMKKSFENKIKNFDGDYSILKDAIIFNNEGQIVKF